MAKINFQMNKLFLIISLLATINNAYSQTQDVIRTADSLFFNQQAEKALTLLTKALDDGNESPFIYHRIGIIKLESYRKSNALEFLLKARELSTDQGLDTALFLDIGQAKYATLDYSGALEELSNLYNNETYRIPALTMAMNVYSDSGNLEKAIELSRKIISMENKSFPVIANIGYLYLDINKPDSAIYYFEKAAKLQPNHPIIINNLGNCYYKKGDLQQALNLINESISLLDTNPYAFRNRALVNLALNNNLNACEDIDRAIELGYLEMYGDDIQELKNDNCE